MRYVYLILLSLVFITSGFRANASHIYGADFYYQFVSGNTYKISLVIYGDCGGAQFPSLTGATPQVLILESGVQKASINLSQQGPGVEVTPVCSSLIGSTNCSNLNATLKGVKRFIYSANYNLPSPYISNNWVFRFNGTMGAGAQAGRSNSITNINLTGPGGGSVVTMEAFLNNINGNNSSPTYTTIPTPFFCINVAQQYNQGAVDINNDSLVYALAPGLQGTGTVTYNPGYSATNPLATATGTFSFNTATGQMNFTPNAGQISLVVNEVKEYRNGVLVGTSSREMTFVVLTDCNAQPASNSLDTIKNANSGGVVANPNIFNVCQGADSVHFGIVAINPAADTLIASVLGLPSGATANILNNNTTSPKVVIDWKTATVAPGSYNLFVTYKDNGCPLTSTQTVAYTINVIRPNVLHYSILNPTHCIHKAYVRYDLANGVTPRTVVISRNGTTIDSFLDNSGLAYDSLATGVYSVHVTSSTLLCTSDYTMAIVDSGSYPYRPKVLDSIYYCNGDVAVQLVATPDSGAVLHWWDANGVSFGFPPTPNTSLSGIFTYQVDQVYKVCESARDSITVFITDRPVAGFSGPESVCENDTATFVFTGKVGVGPILNYVWDWDNAGYVSGASGGPWQVKWFGDGIKTIKLRVDENKCPSFDFTKTINVRPIPFAGFYARSPVCQFDSVLLIYNTSPKVGQDFTWKFDGADIPDGNAIGPYVVHYLTPGLKHISLSVNLAGCTDTREVDVLVNPVPDAKITNVAGPICIGDKVYLVATGGAKYDWSPSGDLFHDNDGNLYAVLVQPITYMVHVTSGDGCVDSASISYKTIEPCCQFSFPNAFSPNGDGHNDIFHVVTYGNQIQFELSIYNNWGQRVYYGLNAKEGWDGNFKGKPCPAGSYFYYLNAKCFTGHQETQKGDLILIR